MMNETVSVAELLREAREARGLSIQAIAKEICVRSTYLKDIDAGRFERLPAPAFSVGFVRAYAKMVGLDSEEIAAAFKEEIGANAAPQPKIDLIDAAVEPPRRGLPAWLSPVAGLVGVSLCWFLVGGNMATLGFSTQMASDDNAASVAEEKAQLAAVKAQLPSAHLKNQMAEQSVATPDIRKPEAVQVAAADDMARMGAVVPEAASPGKAVYEEAQSLFLPAAHASSPRATATTTEGDVTLKAREDSWVRLANADGSELWSGVLREGQTYSPQHDGQLYLSTSNAGGLMVAVGGAPAHALGHRGEIISDLKLSSATQLSAARPASADLTGSR